MLRSSVGETLQQAALHVVDIENSLVGPAVYRLRLCAYEHALAIWRQYISVEGINLLTNGVVNIEEYGRLLSRSERILHNLLSVLRNLCILVGTFQWVDTADTLGRKGSVGYRLQVYLAGSDDR